MTTVCCTIPLLLQTISGGESNGDFAVLRYNSDGTLDTSFGSSGMTIVDLNSSSSDAAYALAVQSDGGILVAGASNGYFAAIRLTSGGALDTTFGSAGIDVLSFSGAASALSIASDGSIYHCGTDGSANAVSTVIGFSGCSFPMQFNRDQQDMQDG